MPPNSAAQTPSVAHHPIVGAASTLYIDGAWESAQGGATFEATSPATGAVLGVLAEGSRADASRAVAAAAAAAPAWGRTSPFERAAALERIASRIEARRDDLARVLTLDQGKPLHAEAYGEVDELLLANSERVEVLVRGGAPGSRTVLQTLPYDRYLTQTRPQNWNRTLELVELRTSTEAPVPALTIPATLRVIRPIDSKVIAARRTIVLAQGMINGQKMDMRRVDLRGRLGTTEIWEIENVVGMDHPFHMHGFQFQVLDRNGVPEPFRAWKDSVNVPKHETVRLVVRFDDYGTKRLVLAYAPIVRAS